MKKFFISGTIILVAIFSSIFFNHVFADNVPLGNFPILPQGSAYDGLFRQIPLTDGCMASAGGSSRNRYAGSYTYGLYGNCSNSPSATQTARLNAAASAIQPLDINGNPSGSGHIALMTIGHSINQYMWDNNAADWTQTQNALSGTITWMLGLATNIGTQPSVVPHLNPALTIVEGALSLQQSNFWVSNVADNNYSNIASNLLSPVWAATFHYTSNTLIVDSNGHTQKLTGSSPCISGSSTPSWNSSGGTTSDGSGGSICTWTDEGILANSPLRLSNKQVQAITGSLTLVLFHGPSGYGVPNGTVTTSGTAVTYNSGTNFQFCSGGGWSNYPVYINGVQYTIQSCSSNNNMTLTTSAGVQSSAVTWSLQDMNETMPNVNSDEVWNARYIGEDVRETMVQYPNLKIFMLYSDPYFGYNGQFIRGTRLRSEPWGFESGFSVQEVVNAQTNQMDTLTSINSCTVSSGTVTCTTNGLPSTLTTGKTIQVAGVSNATFDTACTAVSCPGATVTVSGSSFSYTPGSASGASSTGGHVSVIFDSVLGGLESQDGTAPVLAWGPYLWIDGTTARSDGLKYYCEDVQQEGLHESALNLSTVAASNCGFMNSAPISVTQSDDTVNGHAYGGVGLLGNLFLNYFTGCTTSASCTPPWGGSAYAFGPVSWTNSWMCATGHTGPGCQ